MRGGIPIVVFIVSFGLCLFLFLICSYTLGVANEQIQTAINQTDSMGIAGQNAANFIISGLQRIFGIFCVITMIGIIIAYALDSHRQEGEEFQYYERYR